MKIKKKALKELNNKIVRNIGEYCVGVKDLMDDCEQKSKAMVAIENLAAIYEIKVLDLIELISDHAICCLAFAHESELQETNAEECGCAACLEDSYERKAWVLSTKWARSLDPNLTVYEDLIALACRPELNVNFTKSIETMGVNIVCDVCVDKHSDKYVLAKTKSINKARKLCRKMRWSVINDDNQ